MVTIFLSSFGRPRLTNAFFAKADEMARREVCGLFY
jgi:hypothetical protein